MLVCVCKGISDKSISSSLASGAASFREIKTELGIGTCCGQCIPFAKEMVADKIAEIQSAQNFHLAQAISF